jgi:acetyl-CoA carboxylase biotin carboxyl carrier protein
MNTQQIEEVLSWLKSTDLVEISYRQGTKGFSLATSEAQAAPHYPAPSSRFIPIGSPAVGLFQWSEPGRPRVAEEGAEVSAGQKLGLVETGKGKSTVVTAPEAGRLARVMVESGNAVEFGQPLFFIEPAA